MLTATVPRSAYPADADVTAERVVSTRPQVHPRVCGSAQFSGETLQALAVHAASERSGTWLIPLPQEAVGWLALCATRAVPDTPAPADRREALVPQAPHRRAIAPRFQQVAASVYFS